MNTHLLDTLNSDDTKIEMLSIESLDLMIINSFMDDDDISLEDGLFGKIKDISGKIATFFKNIFDYIKDMLNIRKRLSSMLETNTHKEVKNRIKTATKLMEDVKYTDIAEISIPVPLGFKSKLLPILENVSDNGKEFIKRYNKMMKSFDIELSDYISVEDNRNSFTVTSDDKKNKKYITDFDDVIMSRFNRKQVGSDSSIDEVFGNKGDIIKCLEAASKCYEVIPEKEYKTALDLMVSMSSKIEALYELVEVEKEPVSKASLKAIINAIEIAANFNTVIGKVGLITFEGSTLVMNTINVIEKIKK